MRTPPPSSGWQGAVMTHDVGVEDVDDVERVGADDRHARQVAGRELEPLVLAVLDHEHPAAHA